MGHMLAKWRRGLLGVSGLRLILSIVILVAMVWILRMVQEGRIQTFEIVSESMMPTLNVGDVWLMTPVKEIQVGDIVVFRPPDDPHLVVKRVVAMPGDTVELRQGGQLYVNSLRYPPPGGAAETLPMSNQTWQVGEGEVFVAGDNRDYSRDSRDYGPIPIESIEGKLTKQLRE